MDVTTSNAGFVNEFLKAMGTLAQEEQGDDLLSHARDLVMNVQSESLVEGNDPKLRR